MDDLQDEVDSNDDLDPRIQDELNLLNSSSNDINRLENEIDEARAKYRSTFSDASHKMGVMGRELKKYIQRARQYYGLKEAAVQAQSEALRAARQFQTANGVYRAAKETIALAEQKLMDDQSAAMLSSAWQEMLNHATIRVMEAEREKTRSEEEHLRRSSIFANLECKMQFLEKKFKKSIAKSRPYFEMKGQLELRLQQQKQNIDDLQNAIKSSKKQYSESLRRLEGISEEIHESRRQKILLMFPREPGVGADDESLGSSISEPNLEAGLFSSSSPNGEHPDFDIDIEDSDDVFGSDSHVTTDSPGSSCISISDKVKGTKDGENNGNLMSCVDQVNDVRSKGGNSLPTSHREDSSVRNIQNSKTESELSNALAQCDIANGNSAKNVNTEENIGPRGIHDGSLSGEEVRECGSGAEQVPVCSDNVTVCDKKVTACDISLPERDDNQTEGSSDPEESVKDLTTRDNNPHKNDQVLATEVL